MITQKQKFKKFSSKKGKKEKMDFVILVIFVILIFILAYSNFKLLERREVVSKKLKELQLSLENLKKEKEKLENRVLKANLPEYLETQARQVYNLKKEGEKVVIIVGEKNPSKKEPKTKLQEEIKKNKGKKGILEKILDFIKSFPTDLNF